uniref:Hypothetical chloroplast RF19 n=1 Tax=Clitoria ternatea TaxID=43366 RepID=A0A6H0ED79_CLITE|nr:hypothetical chloroplast RF19 [Clitoria ternatea]QIS99934.1 hypothetical chloroplast RF19 [Clitoria ternatea]
MIFQSFILDNLVSLCMKIINSIVVVGLYYGFLTTFSIGPSYLFLLRTRVMQEGTEKKVSATTGFITGQLMMFISIYYAPLHLALGRPHTITVIALPYLLFQFFGNNHKNFLNYGNKNPNSIRNLSIQRIFFNNLIFQLLNPFFLPSSMLIRLVNVYLFRCNNKLLFLTSNFVGWLIGHIFLIKWIELLLVCIQQNNYIKSNVPIKSNKYIMLELRNSMSNIFLVLFFITCLYYLGRIPTPLFSKKLSGIQKMNGIDKKRKLNIEKILQTRKTKQKRYIKKKSFLFLKKEKNLYKINEEKYNLRFYQKPLLTILFNYKRWNRPLRYIKNNKFENIVRNEMSEFFFHTYQNDGKKRISFTYPSNLSTFHKMIETKIYLLLRDKFSSDKFLNYWNYTNEEKRKKLSNEFLNRAKVLDKEFFPLDIFENRIRLCNDETKTKYLTKIYDPFLNGTFRGRIHSFFSPSIKNKSYKKNDIFLINKIHGVFFFTNNLEFEQKIDTLNRKSLVTEFFFFFNLMSQFYKRSLSRLNLETLHLFREHNQVQIYSQEKKNKIKILFNVIRTDLNDKTTINGNRTKKCIGINEISKEVPLWSYKFIDELKELEEKTETNNYQIRSRKAKRVVVWTKNLENNATYNDTGDRDNTEKKKNELALIRYSQQPDFRRDIIKGSIRAQRRKIVTWKLFQRNVHSPLFLDKIDKPLFFCFDSFESIIFFFLNKNWIRKKTEFQISDYSKEKQKQSDKENEEKKRNQNEEKKRIEIGETWDTIIVAQVIRGLLLITQLILRKYIVLPSLIITKNLLRILFFQFPEWSEDYRDWKREIYVKCTYNGVQLSETEFPKNWLTDGIQIKILFPFRLKPWHRSKVRSTKKDQITKKNIKKKNFCFLTIWGREVELPFSSSPKNRFSFFDPIFKELKKKMKKNYFFFFLVLKVLTERIQLFLNILKETAKRIIKDIQKNITKSILFLNKNKNSNFILVFLKLKKMDELSESKKDSTICEKNSMISESTILIQSRNSEKFSLTENKIKDLNVKTKTIIKQIEKLKNVKRLEFEKNILPILQRGNVRLIRKSHSFFKFFMKRIYIDFFIYIVSIPGINIHLSLESTKKMINKYIYNNERNNERTSKTNQSIIKFISIIQKYRIFGNSQNSCNISFLSQAYVFFKLSQTEIFNIYKSKFKYVFEFHEKMGFLKNEVKDSFFGVQRIFHSKFKYNNPSNSVMNQWTNWLKGHYQYDLSQGGWSRLVSQKWINRINERRVVQKKKNLKWDSYAKTRLIHYKKQEVDGLKKKKWRKRYRYDILSYNSINYLNKKDSYISIYTSFQTKKKQAIYSNYNTNTKKLFDIMGDISIKNYLVRNAIIHIDKNMDRKFFDWIGIRVGILNYSILNAEPWFFSKFVTFYNAYRKNPWIIPIKLLFLDFNENQNVSENKNNIIGKKKKFELETGNRVKAERADQVNLESSISNQEKNIEKNYAGLDSKKNSKNIKKKKDNDKMKAELNFLLRKFFTFHLAWNNSIGQNIFKNVKVYCLLIRLQNIKEIVIASIERGEFDLNIMMIHNQNNFILTDLSKNKDEKWKEMLIIEPVRLSRKNNKQFFMYQITGLSLIHKNKGKINQRYAEKRDIDKKKIEKYITRRKAQKITEKQEKKNYDLFIPENILSPRRCRELRILICLNPRNRNNMHKNTIFYNENKVINYFQVLTTKKDLDRDTKKLMNFKIFLWPNYRLEDLACINRYWFNTHNGSRFNILRIRMYP